MFVLVYKESKKVSVSGCLAVWRCRDARLAEDGVHVYSRGGQGGQEGDAGLTVECLYD